MKTAVIALTRKGSELAVKLGEELNCDIYIKKEFIENGRQNIHPINKDFTGFVGDMFAAYRGIIFIMACGIVVRAIASYIKDKRTDPAVVVIDEMGKFVISLLSGHIGGANKLAQEVAVKTGGTAVITTATDVNDVLAFDLLATENGCIIENIGTLKYISSELVNGGCVGLNSEFCLNGRLPDNIIQIEDAANAECRYSVLISNNLCVEQDTSKVLIIRPGNLILGIGCKKGISGEQICEAVEEFMLLNGKSILSLKHVATVDLKEKEKGILDFCSRYRLELKIVKRRDIEKIESSFTRSDFVKEKIGIAGVAEPCAVLSSKNARLIIKKTVYKGITLALSEEEKVIYI